jgi:outer membrane protein TolC
MLTDFLRRIWVPLLGLSLGWLPLSGQTSHVLTLEQAISYGLEHSKNIQNARFDEYIARAQVKETVAQGLPQISGKIEPQGFLQLPKTILPGAFSPEQEIVQVRTADGGVRPIPVTRINPETGQPIPGPNIEAVFGFPIQYSMGATLNQLLFDGTFFLGLKAAKTFRQLAHQQLNRSREEVAIAVSQAYYQALIVQERTKIVEANIARVEQLFKETEGRYVEGFVEKIDVDRLRINLNNLRLEREKVNRLVQVSRDLLKFQMGMPLGDQVELDADLERLVDQRPQDTPDEAAFDPRNRMEYSLLQTQREIESYNLRRIRAGYFPSVYLFGNYQYQYQGQPDESTDNPFDLSGIWFPLSVVGVTVNVPIFDGLRKHQQMQQSQLEMRKLDNQAEMLTQSTQLEARQTYADLRNAYASVQSTGDTRQLAQEVYETTRIKYKAGVGSSLEVNEAESQLNEAEANYLSALLEYLLAQTDYQRALGAFGQYHE